MSGLHNKMAALGDLSGRTLGEVIAACGEPSETASVRFTDIGEGTRATWHDGLVTVTLNFDMNGRYCGIHQYRNLGPYIWLSVITVFIISAALIVGAQMRKNAAQRPLDAASLQTLLLDNEAVWLHDATAGICLLDLDSDGTPELLATDTEIVWYDELEAYYFGDSHVAVYSLSGGAVTPLGGYTSDEYCFLATLHRYTGAGGTGGWYYTSGGNVWLLSLEDGAVVTGAAAAMPDISGGDAAMNLLRNEAWVTRLGETPDPAAVEADVAAVAEGYFAAG